jgi:hypothetical protein
MCQTPNRPVMIGLSPATKRAIVFVPDCEMWSCPECAPKLRARWIARVAHGVKALLATGEPVQFVTITSHERLKTFQACHAKFPDAWQKLYKAIKRLTPELTYALIPEKHQDGRMHMHMLSNTAMTTRWLKDNARSRGLGFQAYIKPVENVGHAAVYVSKYLGKGLDHEPLPPHFRRIRLSQNWAVLPELHEPSNAYDWLACRSLSGVLATCQECQKTGLTMIDLATGEYFDVMDLAQRYAWLDPSIDTNINSVYA